MSEDKVKSSDEQKTIIIRNFAVSAVKRFTK